MILLACLDYAENDQKIKKAEKYKTEQSKTFQDWTILYSSTKHCFVLQGRSRFFELCLAILIDQIWYRFKCDGIVHVCEDLHQHSWPWTK